MTKSSARAFVVVLTLLLPVTSIAALGQPAIQTPNNISISVDSANPLISTVRSTRPDGTFEARGVIVGVTRTETRLTIDMTNGNYTWSLAGRPASTKEFRTLQLTFENPRGNMIGFRASYN